MATSMSLDQAPDSILFEIVSSASKEDWEALSRVSKNFNKAVKAAVAHYLKNHPDTLYKNESFQTQFKAGLANLSTKSTQLITVTIGEGRQIFVRFKYNADSKNLGNAFEGKDCQFEPLCIARGTGAVKDSDFQRAIPGFPNFYAQIRIKGFTEQASQTILKQINDMLKEAVKEADKGVKETTVSRVFKFVMRLF